MTAKAIYIYGIIPNFYSSEMFRSLENSGVFAIPFQNISAIVSGTESKQPDYSARESLGHLLVHHQKTIEDLMGKGFNMIIPMRLGTIVSSKEEVFKILANGYDLINDSLKKIENLTEIDIAVSWGDFSGILKEISETPEIISLKDDILKKSDIPSQLDQVKVGMLIQRKIKEKNTGVELNILDSLSQISLDIKTHEVMNDEMITNSAFLIKMNNREKFEKIIDNIDQEFKGLLNFKLVGPLPCYSFYTIEVKKLNHLHIAQAKKDLGLGEDASESEIKKAYLGKARLFHPDAQKENGDGKNFDKINKAYNTLLEYLRAVKQSGKGDLISLGEQNVINNLILIKIKE